MPAALIRPLDPGRPPPAFTKRVQSVQIEGVSVGEAGEQSAATPRAGRIDRMYGQVAVDDPGYAAQYLRPDHGRVGEEVSIALQVTEPVGPPNKAMADDPAAVVVDDEIPDAQFVVRDGLNLQSYPISKRGVHTAAVYPHDRSPAPLKRLRNGGDALSARYHRRTPDPPRGSWAESLIP